MRDDARLRVLDLTDELAFAGARLLVGLGADVVRVARPEETRATPAERLHWHAGKRVVEPGRERAATVHRLAAAADVILESGPARDLIGVELDPGPASLWSHAIHVVVTPFGLTGPRRDWTGDDLVIAAAGGMGWLGGRPDGPPKPPPREQALQLAGTHAVVGAWLALRARERDGLGQLVQISAQEAVAATLETAAIAWIHAGQYPRRNGGVYEHVAHRIFATADGHVAGGYSGSERMWTDLLAWLADCGEASDLTDPDWADADHRWTHRPHVDEVVAAFAAKRTSAELGEQGRARALPWAEVATAESLRDNPQLRARDFFLQIIGPDVPGDGVVDAGFPFASTACHRPVTLAAPVSVPASALGWDEPASRPAVCAASGRPALAGLRVLDLTWVLAGPYATKVLAEHGADVIKVESRFRQDPTRFAPSMRLRPDAGFDDGGYFLNFNRGKRSVAVNLRTEQGQELVRDLAAHCDVVIENFSPGVLAKWKLDHPNLAARNPDTILVSMAGLGQNGPWRDAVTFADTLAAMSGLTAETADADGVPQGLAFGLGDMVAANAAVLALLERLHMGAPGHVDLSQLEAMVASMGTAVLEPQLGQNRRQAPAAWPNRYPGRVPHGTYPARGDDRWLAIAVTSDEQWRALCTVIGSGLAPFADAEPAERFAHEDEVDAALSRWTAERDGAESAARLQGAGVPAALVATGADLVDHDDQLAARGFYPELSHPVAGRVKHEGIVVGLTRTPGLLTHAAPLLGEHTDAVLRELLDLPEPRIAELRSAGVLQ